MEDDSEALQVIREYIAERKKLDNGKRRKRKHSKEPPHEAPVAKRRTRRGKVTKTLEDVKPTISELQSSESCASVEIFDGDDMNPNIFLTAEDLRNVLRFRYQRDLAQEKEKKKHFKDVTVKVEDGPIEEVGNASAMLTNSQLSGVVTRSGGSTQPNAKKNGMTARQRNKQRNDAYKLKRQKEIAASVAEAIALSKKDIACSDSFTQTDIEPLDSHWNDSCQGRTINSEVAVEDSSGAGFDRRLEAARKFVADMLGDEYVICERRCAQ